ncbi:MAG: DUF115 domain-containing protein [Dorea sp.]|nr:DUF115 domain-containing protein [Dorea sp.]
MKGEGKTKVYLFGAGVNGKKIASIIGEESIIAFVDNSHSVIGERILGVEVISFLNFVKEYKGEEVLITSVYMANDIEQQLRKERITNIYKCPFIPSNMIDIVKWTRGLFEKYKILDVPEINLYPFNLLTRSIAARIREQGYGGKIKLLDNEDELNIGANEAQGDFLMVLCDEENICSPQIIDLSCDNCGGLDFEGLRKYKNIYKDDKCFIIGNGPSLTSNDLDILYRNNIKCFGCNGIYKIFDQTNWRPDYYILGDPDAFRSNGHILRGQKYFVADVMKQFDLEGSSIEYFHHIFKVSKEGYALFSDDIVHGVSGGGTATFVMLQFAVYMGFKEIYLLGVDFSWGENGGKTHFCNEYVDSKYEIKIRENVKHKNMLLKTYESAQKYTKEHGIKIYNATRGGNLEVFERVDFDFLF